MEGVWVGGVALSGGRMRPEGLSVMESVLRRPAYILSPCFPAWQMSGQAVDLAHPGLRIAVTISRVLLDAARKGAASPSNV